MVEHLLDMEKTEVRFLSGAFMATKTVYALQQFFIGEWEDWEVVGDKELAKSKYATFSATHYRSTRLVERTESVLYESKPYSRDD